MDTKVLACLLMIPIVSSVHPYQGKDNQVLGVLKPAHVTSAGSFPPYLTDLLPELIAASSQIKGYNVIETLMAYMPFARKIMAAQSPTGKLSAEQEKLITFTEKVVPPMMKFVEGLYGGNSLTDMPLNATPDYDFTEVMLKLLPDISAIINQLKAKHGGWPGTTKSLEILNAFMPLARKASLIQAQKEGRHITKEEDKYLTFAERVVPSVMDYSQALYYRNIQPGQEYQIEQLVKSAVADLHLSANKASLGSYGGQRLQPLQAAYPPVTYTQRFGYPHQPYQIAPVLVGYDQSSEDIY